MTDQNGTVHTYQYDALGRPTADVVTTLGAGVDGAVRRIGRTYEVRGMVEAITSYSDTAGATPVNEVLNVHDDFGQLVAQYQEHGGAVDVETTPVVTYGYADGWDNTTRLESMTYPDGRVLDYLHDDEAADRLSRVRTLRWDGVDVCRYEYLGLATFVTTDYLEPGVRLNYAGSNYSGFDRFGRVVDLHWQRYGTPPSSSSSESDPAGDSLVHLQYGYDRSSSRTSRRDLVATAYGKAFDELYGYDGMHRLETFGRGTLNSAGTVISSPTYQQTWDLDATGNWDGFTQTDAADSSNTLTQSRTANAVNEITAISQTVGSTWATPEYDSNGNVTLIPQPKDMTQAYRATWDAWNRLVKLEEPDGSSGWQTLQENAYDGQAWRVAVKEYDGGTLDETRHVYFTSGWQDIESRLATSPSTADAEHQYVWGQRYVDDCVLRDRETASTGPLDERLYAIADADWDVVAIASYSDGSSETAFRFAYTPYGDGRAIVSNYSSGSAASSRWSRLNSSADASLATGLAVLRTRWLHCKSGRFISRDLIGYAGGTNIYSYANGSPTNGTDPFGLMPVAKYYDPWTTWDFLYHYRYGEGRAVDLVTIGLQDVFFRHPNVQDNIMDFLNAAWLRAIEALQTAPCDERTVAFEFKRDSVTDVTDTIFVIGNSHFTREVKCKGWLSPCGDCCNGKPGVRSRSYSMICDFYFGIRDRFRDPLDTEEWLGTWAIELGRTYGINGGISPTLSLAGETCARPNAWQNKRYFYTNEETNEYVPPNAYKLDPSFERRFRQ